ncbi:transcription factor [Ganoderma sinense ZZ0214-1]|uniref:Transcription factor n=1 Tax=Ganoderma sinense ZZ0214-1 TaxID=1077348 RepID=A0A2G8SK41_9APHY|nr:transcription factor [Ganoderma sinense ZZ0214-1]
MTDLEFVIEAPQAMKSNKKRPRLVTSCDHCRVKKIKCVQQPATGKCEACLSSNVPCHYRDREQYFAERTRLLSGGGSGMLRDASANAQNAAHLSAIDAYTPSSSRGSSPSYMSRSGSSSTSSISNPSYSPFSSTMDVSNLDIDPYWTFVADFDSQQSLSTSDAFMQPSSWSPSSSTSSARRTPSMSSSDPAALRPYQATRSSPFLGLFDETDHQQPHPHLMIAFLHVFFEQLGPTFPFLSSESVYERFLHRRLSPLLANAIAASAAPLSTINEIVQIGPANVSDVYCQVAKKLLPAEGSQATIETLHAVMLLSWAEYKRGRQTMFTVYSRMTTVLATDLGISEESLPQLTRVSDLHGGRMLQSTWQGIQLLERTLLASTLVAFATPAFHQPSRSTSAPSAVGPIPSM